MIAEITALLTALAPYAWPAVTVWLARRFQNELRQAASRLSKAEIFGQKFDFQETLKRLPAEIVDVKAEVKALPPVVPQLPPTPPEEEAGIPADTKPADESTPPVAPPEEPARPRRLVLIDLASQIEREMRLLLLTTGWHARGWDSRNLNSIHSMSIAIQDSVRLPSFGLLVDSFVKVRNHIVHGKGSVSDRDMDQAISYGLAILKIVTDIPREVNEVYDPGTVLFADSDGQQPIEGVRGLILKTTVPGRNPTLRIFPTTRQDYEKGDLVSWEWNLSRQFSHAWYKHPETGKITKAWEGSTEFVGRSLDDLL